MFLNQRASYEKPWILSKVDSTFYGEKEDPSDTLSIRDLVKMYADYSDQMISQNSQISDAFLAKPLMYLMPSDFNSALSNMIRRKTKRLGESIREVANSMSDEEFLKK